MSTQTFTIHGRLNAEITVTEDDGNLVFEVQLLPGNGSSIGDLRALFFDVDETLLTGNLVVTGDAAVITDSTVDYGSVDTLGKDANIKGEVSNELGDFDVGVEIGTSGMEADDYQYATFTLSSDDGQPLTLALIGHQDFAVRATSVGEAGGDRNGGLKMGGGNDNFAPDAVDDTASVSEDGPSVVIDLTGNDSDGDGDPLTIDSFDFTDLKGSVTDNGDGTVTYDPDGRFDSLDSGDTAHDTFSYTITDGHGGYDTAEVDVTINGESDQQPLDVLIINADSGQNNQDPGASVEAGLEQLGEFGNVDLVNIFTSATPTVATMSDYDAILVYSNVQYVGGGFDYETLGDNLKAYIDTTDGGVVLANLAFSSPWNLTGGIMETGYSPFTVGATNTTVTGSIVVEAAYATDPVFDGVDLSQVNGAFFINENYANPGLDTGAELLATDGNGVNMIARNATGDVMGLNIFPEKEDPGETDFFELFANSLTYVSDPDAFV